METTTKRKRCKDCPWNKNNEIHESWTSYVFSAVSDKKEKTVKHACHKIEEDSFDKVTSHNICIGSLEKHNETQKTNI